MAKSLGEYVIEKSSSTDIQNITWTQKNPKDAEKPKKKKSDKRHQNSSASKCKIKPEFKRPAR